MENILEAVYKSKRVLCVVTSNFLLSRYCSDEFNIAQTRNVELKKRRLSILKYEEFDIGAQIDTGTKNVGKEQNQDEIGDIETQQFILSNTSTHRSENGVLDKALVLRDFITRHRFINLSTIDSWRDQLLYAMLINRLGHVAAQSGSGENI